MRVVKRWLCAHLPRWISMHASCEEKWHTHELIEPTAGTLIALAEEEIAMIRADLAEIEKRLGPSTVKRYEE